MRLNSGHHKLLAIFSLFLMGSLLGCTSQVDFDGEATDSAYDTATTNPNDEMEPSTDEGEFFSSDPTPTIAYSSNEEAENQNSHFDCPEHENRLSELEHNGWKSRSPRNAVIVDWGYDFYLGGSTTITVEIQNGAGEIISSDDQTQIWFEPEGGSAIIEVVCGKGDQLYGAPYKTEVVVVQGGVATIRVTKDSIGGFNVRAGSLNPDTPMWGFNTTGNEVLIPVD